jgi:hypothetical protein
MDTPATIFISIASYRDPELIPTLQDMLRHAAHPENLHIAICWQDDENLSLFEESGMTPEGSRIVDSHEVFAFRYRQARVDVISVHYYASQGACWARSMAETLYEQEAWFPANRFPQSFIPNWDTK